MHAKLIACSSQLSHGCVCVPFRRRVTENEAQTCVLIAVHEKIHIQLLLSPAPSSSPLWSSNMWMLSIRVPDSFTVLIVPTLILMQKNDDGSPCRSLFWHITHP